MGPCRVRIPEIMMQQKPALYICVSVCVCVYIYGQLLLISISSKLAACTHIPGLNDERKLSVQSWGLWGVPRSCELEAQTAMDDTGIRLQPTGKTLPARPPAWAVRGSCDNPDEAGLISQNLKATFFRIIETWKS